MGLQLANIFGILGNIISVMVYLAPMSTFNRIYKKKSTEEYQSIPYVIALLSATLWVYYAILKGNVPFLLAINTVGCLFETFYICLYIYYATRHIKVQTLSLLVLLNFVGLGLVVVLSEFLLEGQKRRTIVEWICVLFSIIAFAAPMCILKQVFQTRSVEYMPFTLSFVLTLSAIIWFLYGTFINDNLIAVPNMLGISFGIIQMVVYAVYKDARKTTTDEESIHDQSTILYIDEGVEDTPAAPMSERGEIIEDQINVLNIEESNS